MTLLFAVFAMLWREDNPAWKTWQARYNGELDTSPVPIAIRNLTPTMTGKPELCVTCHVGIEDISASHPAQTFGCVVCHGGEPLALDADRAHATLRGGRNPSDLSAAKQSCGQTHCHGGYADSEQNHVDRVLKSLQATYAGGIASVRYTFGAQSTPLAQFGLDAIADAEQKRPATALPALGEWRPLTDTVEFTFQQNCVDGGCHLGTSPAKPQSYYYRSTGCAACHYLYDDDGLYRGQDPTIPRDLPGHGVVHRLTTAIPYTQCDHCHNRGNYSLKQMAFLPREDLPPIAAPIPATMPTEGRRLKEYYQPIAEFTKCEYELNCVDCHTAQEAMGDGHIYGSKKDAQSVQCQTCHGTPASEPQAAAIQDPDELAMRQARINGRPDFLAVGDRVIATERGELLWAIKKTANGFLQMDKVTGQIYRVPLVMGSKCEQDGKTQSSVYCHTCHAVER
ncbi:MAG: hypothetical protein HY782_17680 [Chloroflexi bacterium]|nr:hypothetical protein [Chloroflexota bacterium]